jgi:hypothetical protein
MVDHSSSISTAIYEAAPNDTEESTFCHHPIDPTPDLQRAIQHQYAEQEMKLT